MSSILTTGKLLERIAEQLDIPPSLQEQARERYQSVGEWLDAPGSELKPYGPKVSSQGSLRLGTVVKPISNADEYDVDVVCELEMGTKDLTQRGLKSLVGNRLKSHRTYQRMLDAEGRRCWTLNYADDVSFHLDILPSIPDPDWLRLTSVVDFEKARRAILITDKTYPPEQWPCSNPEGYAQWFFERIPQFVFESYRLRMAEDRAFASVEDFPDYFVRTPLQRVVQILKRHRDMSFRETGTFIPENKPISIIITTLAGEIYTGEEEILEALISVVEEMPRRMSRNNLRLINPVNPDENFADKWIERPQLAQAFFAWCSRLAADFGGLSTVKGTEEIANYLKPILSPSPVDKALIAIGERARGQRETGDMRMNPSGVVGSVGAVAVDHRHTFYGK